MQGNWKNRNVFYVTFHMLLLESCTCSMRNDHILIKIRVILFSSFFLKMHASIRFTGNKLPKSEPKKIFFKNIDGFEVLEACATPNFR